jgi:hypothetical protein
MPQWTHKAQRQANDERPLRDGLAVSGRLTSAKRAAKPMD